MKNYQLVANNRVEQITNLVCEVENLEKFVYNHELGDSVMFAEVADYVFTVSSRKCVVDNGVRIGELEDLVDIISNQDSKMHYLFTSYDLDRDMKSIVLFLFSDVQHLFDKLNNAKQKLSQFVAQQIIEGKVEQMDRFASPVVR